MTKVFYEVEMDNVKDGKVKAWGRVRCVIAEASPSGPFVLSMTKNSAGTPQVSVMDTWGREVVLRGPEAKWVADQLCKWASDNPDAREVQT